jgi:hypothetical protein
VIAKPKGSGSFEDKPYAARALAFAERPRRPICARRGAFGQDAKAVDIFDSFSIGSNDLTQVTLARRAYSR